MSKDGMPTNPEDPDAEISDGAKARKLRFRKVPETEVRFHGSPGRESASGSDRENLPDRVESGVTYRDAGIRWRAASKLVADDRLTEALKGGEAEEHGRGSRDPEQEDR